ncbi:PREDICTED: tripartite motif-containing protein 7-like [Gekko japonicus]|uniref:RING-type E3 ubiquitin transferase n=1 Tax=Gekko japonicus TaxID=146911 RepID=A0ABM1KB08_GEKJA|nr:PREDICTED: tripartite motif-containing protein 7-like [Gekko japonicus]
MAAGGPLEELCEEATCSICLDYFSDPVTIAECGHNFCRACLICSWGDPGASSEPTCPHCRGRVELGSLRPNRQLANFVEITKRFTLQEGEEVAGKGGVCQKHQEPLKLFCKDDQALICVVCDRSKEHRNHKTLPLEEASQEYQDQFRNCLKILKKERERILAYEGDVVKESQELLKQTMGKKQETVVKFRQLHAFLEEQEELLLARMEEVEKEVARKLDQALAKLSGALFSLESLIWEMEKKCEQSARDLLQDVRSTLQRYEAKETFENPMTFPLALKWKIWDVRDSSHFLEGVMKQLKGNLDSGVCMQKAKVTLDQDTAHPELILYNAGKSMRPGEKAQILPNNPERFDRFRAVLGREGFRAGRHFWEVLVGSEGEWAVGVARRSVRRKGKYQSFEEEQLCK